MDILFEWGILSLVGLLIYGVLMVLVHSWRLAAKNYDKKLSEDYVRSVEKHQLSDMGMSTYPDPPPKRKFDRVKVVDKSKDFHANKFSVRKGYREAPVLASLLDSNSYLWESEPISDIVPERLLDSIPPSYDGEGHGGSFGGGGASGSWGSDDNNSSSIYGSDSSDSGGSDSSSSD